ncbi:MAG TPA: FAD-dependent oxidoreductase [Xanthomonadaceae bacterium]|nr:FAD-dependent oxidoreductase [Xanthomonadaceae bacterium]
MRIAVVGSGIAGLGAAWLLSRQHEVVLFEAEDRLGGHTHTHDIELPSGRYAVDSGFIVFNRDHYPLLSRLFAQLGVASQATTMSFALRNDRSGLEYNATSLPQLFVQRRNLVSPRFWSMLRGIARFYAEAPALLDHPGPGPTVTEFLDQGRYPDAFRDDHLVPMASALWSSPSQAILDFPMKYLVAFMANHQMLQIRGRPEWQVVRGGSSCYVRALSRDWPVQVRLSAPVLRVTRHGDDVEVATMNHSERFDQVVLACHSDQALAMLADPKDAEREVLGAISYQRNETVLHTDESLLPRRRRAWAAWNALVPVDESAQCTVTYCMNLLQSLDAPVTFNVTLNRSEAIDPDKVLARMVYHHPVYSHAAVAAQRRRHEISGVWRTWYCGAYWGFGFHEDGLRSGVEVARALGVEWP